MDKKIVDFAKAVKPKAEEKNLKQFEKVSTSSTSSTYAGFEGTRSALGQHSSALVSIEQDSLINAIETKDGKKRNLIIESKAAKVIKEALLGRYAYDINSQIWHKFVGTHWHPLEVQQYFDNELVNQLYVGAGDLGFRPAYKNGIKSILGDGDMLPLPKTEKGKLPFANGLLNLQTRELEPITPSNALTWCLPYQYHRGSDCPSIKNWLLQAVDRDMGTFKFLQAWMAAVLHGRNDLHKFLHLKGSGGTGKSTFIRLVTALVGTCNSVETDLQHLEQNRFETAMLFNKRLAVINESDRYGGAVNVLKKITGQDHIRLERKHQQQSGNFVFPGLVIMASNESLQTTDHSSGLDRRRITVIFNRIVTDEEKQVWESKGGEGAVLHVELPGLVNWLLELSQHDISNTIRKPPERIRDADIEAMAASNPIADWLLECCNFDHSAKTQIGDLREVRESGRETEFQNADIWLYANFARWCHRNSKTRLAKNRFSELLLQTCTTLGHSVEKSRSGDGRFIVGLKLKSLF